MHPPVMSLIFDYLVFAGHDEPLNSKCLEEDNHIFCFHRLLSSEIKYHDQKASYVLADLAQQIELQIAD